jgi:hypothetical protein
MNMHERRRREAEKQPQPSANSVEIRDAEAWLKPRLRRGEREIFSEPGPLTPALAQLLLDRNDANRSVSDPTVLKYAVDMEEHRFAMNGESVKMSRCGRLNDGQHRCLAVILSGCTTHMMFTFGLERETRMTLDQGKQRTPGDYLGMGGVVESNKIAAIAGMIWQYEKHGSIGLSGIHRPTKQQVLAAYHDHPRIHDSLLLCSRKGSAVLGSQSMLAFCHYTFAQRDRVQADAFLESVIKGADLPESDVRYMARTRLLNDKSLRANERAEVLFRAWNHWRRRARVTKVQIAGGKLPAVE